MILQLNIKLNIAFIFIADLPRAAPAAAMTGTSLLLAVVLLVTAGLVATCGVAEARPPLPNFVLFLLPLSPLSLLALLVRLLVALLVLLVSGTRSAHSVRVIATRTRPLRHHVHCTTLSCTDHTQTQLADGDLRKLLYRLYYVHTKLPRNEPNNKESRELANGTWHRDRDPVGIALGAASAWTSITHEIDDERTQCPPQQFRKAQCSRMNRGPWAGSSLQKP